MTLYSLQAEAQELLFYLDKYTDENGEVSEEFFSIQEESENKITEKFDNIGKLIKTIEAENSAIEEEVKRLELRAKRNTIKIVSLMRYVGFVLERFKLEKGEWILFTFQYSKSKSTVVSDISALPKDLQKRSITIEYEQDDVDAIISRLKDVEISFKETSAPILASVKKYIEAMTEEEQKDFGWIAFIQENKNLKMK